ncbi:winged helix-turn-helix transcriptional regulator [Empedobacter falsenii]
MSTTKNRSSCPISCTLDTLGDKWSILILRDMMFSDKMTFGDFLASNEKIASNILTDKLKNLECAELIFKHKVSGKARVGYTLTEKGISLLPLVMEFVKWGNLQNADGMQPAKKTNYNKTIEKMTTHLMGRLKMYQPETAV